MTNKEYNGWTNYETWLVKLWIDNEESCNRFWNEEASRLLEECPDDGEAYSPLDGDRISKLADALAEAHRDALPKLEGFAADLMNAAMHEVNWEEIANSLLEDAKERVTN